MPPHGCLRPLSTPQPAHRPTSGLQLPAAPPTPQPTECLELPHLVHGIVALVASGFYVAAAFLVTMTDFEPNPASKRYMATPHSSVEVRARHLACLCAYWEWVAWLRHRAGGAGRHLPSKGGVCPGGPCSHAWCLQDLRCVQACYVHVGLQAPPAHARTLLHTHTYLRPCLPAYLQIWALTAKTFMALNVFIFDGQLYVQSVIFCLCTLSLVYLFIRWVSQGPYMALTVPAGLGAWCGA